ncbi:hypothetical protein WA1_19045 [Scytonema hofmannii PCC 7110]|uniref:Uncharacterized protein n=1 Tax=Scytonema hofmannii PCC 7110 TaxID=128403 RepID=A0A139XBL2_9CYAN|nr:hypothetical protein [Scytonema hofmannii]KYC42098.1 hypothetical protein WA1_19045 [Scytonema hofmannii PCC 7110]
MANQLYNGIKQNTDVVLEDLETPGRILVIPNASEVSYDPGIELEEVMASTPLGVMQIVDVYPKSQNPVVNLTFPKKTPEILGMKMGLKMATEASMSSFVARNGFKVEGTSYPAATTGYEGFGITADIEGAIASYLDEDGISVPLTQGTFATFSTGSPTLSFAVGLNGAMKFSDDLIGKYVSWRIPVTITDGLYLSEAAFNRFKMNLVFVQNDLRIVSVGFREVIVPGDGEINFTEATMQVSFRVVYNGAGCLPIEIKYLGQARKCQHA